MKEKLHELNQRYRIMDRLLSDFGLNKISHNEFWSKMKEHDLQDVHITWFLQEYHKRERAKARA